MKKAISLLLTLITLFSFSATAAAEGSEKIFPVTEAVITVGENASSGEIYAAERLEYYLEKITGKDISVENDATDSEYEIIVGKTCRSDIAFQSSENGSYVIKSDENTVIISGVGSRGTLYGVYAFLEDYCGCRWYEKDVIKIPEDARLTVPADINVSYTPYFEYTETDTASSRDTEFAVANAQNGGIYKYLTQEQGGNVGYIGQFAHTFVTYFCRPDMYFSEHPEYYALHDGKRVPEQLCLTNPEVFDIVYEEIIALLEKEHDPTKSMQILSLTQHDNSYYCQCKSCKKINNENNSEQGSNLDFVNRMAEKVKATGKYDNIVFDTFAYSYTRKPPTKIVPRDDVIIRLCSIECCFGHTLDDPDCPENVSFMEDLADWSKICDRVYIWDYVTNYSETCCVFPNFDVLQKNIQIFSENNVKGIYAEGNYFVDRCDTEFAEMRTYLLSQLMKDPYMDYYAEMDGYLEAVYGDGWENIREFINVVSKHSATRFNHLTIGQRATKTLPGITQEEIEYCDTLWENALNEAKTEEQIARISRSQLSWRYWKCANRKQEFSRLQFPYLWMTEQDKLYNDLIANGVTHIGEASSRAFSDCEMMHYFRIPFKWTELYEDSIWEALSPSFMKLYSLLGEIYNALYN